MKIVWFVLALALTPQVGDRGGGPCGSLSAQSCLDLTIKVMRDHGVKGKIRAVAIHYDDWFNNNGLMWDFYRNRILDKEGKDVALESIAVESPSGTGIHFVAERKDR